MTADVDKDDNSDDDTEEATWTFRVGVWEIATVVALLVLVAVAGQWWGQQSGRPQFNDVDVGFLRDMTLHHDQAVEMALLELDNPTAESVARSFANEVVLFQRYEIGYMAALLDAWDRARADAEAPVMGWMGRAIPAADMPGLASEDEMNRLESATGSDRDLLFLELMAEHHGGGIGMAEVAADRGDNREAKALADRIARYQRVEINELAGAARRIGGEAAGQRVEKAGQRGLAEHADLHEDGH